jgi:hypothetical protein
MKRKNLSSIENIYIQNQFDKFKNKKVKPDHNNIILNAAAFQQEILKEMGMNKGFRKRKVQTESCLIKVSKNRNDESKSIQSFLPKLLKKEHLIEKDREVMDRQRTFVDNLSLAEKIGIKQIPKMPLSINEWKELEFKSIKREDHKSSCPICLDSLSKRETLILSCSHIFHANCINNFEKLSKTKKCPVCRFTNYETRGYYKDKEYYVTSNIICLQKNIRGFLIRYYLYKTIFSEKMPQNKHLRSIYSKWKISELTNKFVSAMDKKNNDMKKLIQQMQAEVNEMNKKEEDLSKILKENKKEMKFTNWSMIFSEMKKRNNENCAICFAALSNKKVNLLSCSHCFHKNCLDSFEKFDTYYEKRCPMCRSNYEKKEVFLD